MKHLAFGLLLLLLAFSAQAFTLEDWRSWQSATPAFQSQIDQSRWLEESEIRVHANGQLLFTPYRSLVWRWQTPEQRVVELDIAGQFLDLTAAKSQSTLTPLNENDGGLPDEQKVGKLLLGALHGDVATLRKGYHLLLNGERDAWRLALLPRERDDDAPRLITIQGGRFIESMQVTLPNGNALQLELLDHRRLVNSEGASQLREALLDSQASTGSDAPPNGEEDEDEDEEDGEDDDDDDEDD